MLGRAANFYIKKGELVPDDVTCDLILDSILTAEADNVLLDGFPRTHAQAEVVDKATSIDMVLHLDVPGASVWLLRCRTVLLVPCAHRVLRFHRPLVGAQLTHLCSCLARVVCPCVVLPLPAYATSLACPARCV